MNSVVGIIDMDGFTVNKKFHCRELGVIEVDKDEAKSYHFGHRHSLVKFE